MADAMKSTATAMHKMNKVVNVPTITKMLAEFERENQRTEMMQEGANNACYVHVTLPTLLLPAYSAFPR